MDNFNNFDWAAFKYYLHKRSGGLAKYDDAGVESPEGAFVLYEDLKIYIDNLKKRIKQLESDNSSEYAKGYSAGKYAGPDYNMRND